jgi:hypothetical protein
MRQASWTRPLSAITTTGPLEQSMVAVLIDRYCSTDDLSTSDPYDIWKTRLGFRVKELFHRNKYLGLLPAAVLASADKFLNNGWRVFYTRQEYPIVRAFACLSLLNLARQSGSADCIAIAEKHLRWLLQNRCTGYHGYGWGLNFKHVVDRNITYSPNTPFSTVTPYPLEAFVAFSELTGTTDWQEVISRIFDFFERDIQIMEQGKDYLVTSYGPMHDRVVINAVSYTMYSYSLLMKFIPATEREYVWQKIRKLYRFLVESQRSDGSWWYSPEGRSFIDCFHSCIVLKNLIKTNRRRPLDSCDAVIAKGYEYLKAAFLDQKRYLFKRFSEQNRPSLIRFDLYDNAEMLNLAALMGDEETFRRLSRSILISFFDGDDIYSEIDLFGVKRNKNTLRWAVMPLVFALSQRIIGKEQPLAFGRSRVMEAHSA